MEGESRKLTVLALSEDGRTAFVTDQLQHNLIGSSEVWTVPTSDIRRLGLRSPDGPGAGSPRP